MSRVFITGIGLVTPLKPFMGMDAFWKALCSGEDGIRRMPPPLLDAGREWLLGSIDTSSREPSHHDLSRNELTGRQSSKSEIAERGLAKRSRTIPPSDRFSFLAEKAIMMALEDARLALSTDSVHPNMGFILGTINGNILYKEERLMELYPSLAEVKTGFGIERNRLADQKGRVEEREADRRLDEGRKESLSHFVHDLGARYQLEGPLLTVSTSCVSGTDAIGIAARLIQSGRTDAMIAGGADVLSDFALFGFQSLLALTDDKVRPFDKKRSGTALGEGAAFLILESEEHATERDARVYAQMLGYASRADANHLTAPHREGLGLAEAIARAMQEARLDAGEIDYISAHGTGTEYSDLSETKALKRALGEAAYSIPASSIKSMLGHSFGASGAIEAITCLLSMRTGVIPPTINFQEEDPECDLDYVPNAARDHAVKTAMSVSSGLGGQNSVIILRAF